MEVEASGQILDVFGRDADEYEKKLFLGRVIRMMELPYILLGETIVKQNLRARTGNEFEMGAV